MSSEEGEAADADLEALRLLADLILALRGTLDPGTLESLADEVIPYDLGADAHLIWPQFEHERLAVGDVFSVRCAGKPDRALRVTRVIPGPDGQVMYDTEPAGEEASR